MTTRAMAHAPAAFAPPAVPSLAAGDLISIRDLTPAEVRNILEVSATVKARPEHFRSSLAGKQVAMFFEKPSLRTRITFEAGISSMGGTSFFIDQTRSRLGERETLPDIARNLERWVHALVLRTFDHATVTEIADHAAIPVVNGLSDLEHPCQALADYFTVQEKLGDVSRSKLAYVGDGNNVAHSLMLTAAALGSSISIGTPKGYEPSSEIVSQALAMAAKTGARIEVTNDAFAAVAGADVVYTDVWASMGHEGESAKRKRAFGPFRVTSQLMAKATPHAIFMHCLPAHRGEEVTDEVMDSEQSVVFDQAENRLHVQKAILLLLMGGSPKVNARRMNA